MAKLSGLGHLIAAFLALLPWIFAVDISDIFTVQRGNVAASCDDQMDLLDNWLDESTTSVAVALDAIDRYNSDPNVRKAMQVIFHIQNQGKMSAAGKRQEGFKRVKNELEWVFTFLSAPGTYSKDKFWLFCDCTFLESHLPTQPAYDYLGNEIHDDDNEIVTIENVKEYKKALAKEPNARPWWSGAHSALKGYYFTEKGGDYCTASQLAATAHIEELRRPIPADETENVDIASVILCPESFNTTLRQANYRDANNLITDGTNLADGVSSTGEQRNLVHKQELGLQSHGPQKQLRAGSSCPLTLNPIEAEVQIMDKRVTRKR